MILIIGYGNPLRTDDAIGQRIAHLMAQRFNSAAVEVQTVYQLTPELVEPIRRANLVIFIDARVGDTPAVMFQETVEPETGTGAFTHHVSPGALLGAAQALYGAQPKGILLSIVGASFDFGGELSPELDHALYGLADQAEAVIVDGFKT